MNGSDRCCQVVRSCCLLDCLVAGILIFVLAIFLNGCKLFACEVARRYPSKSAAIEGTGMLPYETTTQPRRVYSSQ